MKLSLTYQEFCELAKKHNIIPVCANVSADLETPISVYYKVIGEDLGFMLESAESSSNFGRYSFIGAKPFAVFSAKPESAEVKTSNNNFIIKGKPLEALQKYIKKFDFAAVDNLPPFAGGAVGYLAYEAVATWERNRLVRLAENQVLAELMFCKIIICFDHLYSTTKVIYLAKIEHGDNLAEVYKLAVDEIEEVVSKLMKPLSALPDNNVKQCIAVVESKEDELYRKKYIEMVEKAKEYIAAGDIFQVVLSQQFSREINCHPITIYRRLRRVNPSPYMFYLNFGLRQLIGASPEMLVKVTNGKVETCPIAGTRPRGKDDAEDDCLAQQLLNDIKEKAEHAMLVDLGRNDIGRVSSPGTVKVDQLMQVEKFSHVMHLVSKVSGKLDLKYNNLSALQACFPAGTVSGAPKIRAMEIISELETGRRGAYAGAVGYIDFKGNMDTCITIRTMAVEGKTATIQTGAGIVADSVPEKEYMEIRHKAQVLFKVLEGDDPG